MTTASLPRSRSLLGRVVLSVRSPAARRMLLAVMVAAREHAASFAAFAAISYGAFQAATAAGWIVSGVSVLVLDWQIRG